MVERQLPKLHTRVRFPSPAPIPALFDGRVPINTANIADQLATGTAFAARSAEAMVLTRSIVTVMGPTPPGTGVI
jgi:hypothetical protein